MIRFAIVLAVILVGYWCTLSFYTKPLLLSLGAASILFTLWLCARMKIIDRETVPYLHIPLTMSYFVWLFREIAKANIAVVKAVLKPDMEISPSLIKVPMHQDTDMGRTMFANSITLTPGTVSVAMEDDHILVHALLAEMAHPEDFMDMGEQSGWAVGEAISDIEMDADIAKPEIGPSSDSEGSDPEVSGPEGSDHD